MQNRTAFKRATAFYITIMLYGVWTNRELNPGLLLAKQIYYHYTIGPYVPDRIRTYVAALTERRLTRLDDGNIVIAPAGFEPASLDSKSNVLDQLHYGAISVYSELHRNLKGRSLMF